MEILEEMSDKKIFVKGFRTFPPRPNAPDWVLGDLVVDITEFKEFVNSNLHHLTEYNGKKQLKCQITRGRNGNILIAVNDFNQQPAPPSHPVMQGPASPLSEADDLPF